MAFPVDRALSPGTYSLEANEAEVLGPDSNVLSQMRLVASDVTSAAIQAGTNMANKAVLIVRQTITAAKEAAIDGLLEIKDQIDDAAKAERQQAERAVIAAELRAVAEDLDGKGANIRELALDPAYVDSTYAAPIVGIPVSDVFGVSEN